MSWPSKRELILRDLRSAFAAINGAGAYQITVKTAGRDLVHPDELTTEKVPAIFIDAPLHDLAHLDYQRNTDELRCVATCYVRGQEGASASELLEKLIHDVSIAVYVDITRGGNAISTLLGPQIRKNVGLILPLAGCEVDVTVSFRHSRLSP